MRSVPVNNATESYATAFNTPSVSSCGILNRDGIFYASLCMENSDAPLEVALHGVQSEKEAQQAFQTLATLRQARCLPATPVSTTTVG
jgi:hypothetical protein